MKKEILMIGILALFALTGTAFAETGDSEANDWVHNGTGSWIMCSEPESVEEPANVDGANVTRGNVSMNDKDEISYASGKTWYVDDDGGPGIDFTKIQDAVNAATAGDTIIVKNGTYNEQVKVNKQLTIEGENRPIINAAGKPLYSILIDHTSGCVIKGFEIKPSVEVEVGIYLYYSHSNQIIDNIASNHCYGVAVVYSNDNVVNANVVYDNLGGIGIWYSTGTNISDNIAHDNFGSGGEDSGNIGINWANNNDIINNTVYNATAPGAVGIGICDSDNCIVTDNTARNNQNGIYTSGSSNTSLNKNIMENNTYNFGTLGTSSSDFIHTIDTSNTINGKPIFYLVNESDQTVDATDNAGYVGVVNSSNIVVENLNLSNNIDGVLFAFTNNSEIKNLYITHNLRGICLKSSSNNQICHNTLIDNSVSAYDDKGNNNWNTSYPSGGNYWSDYSGTDKKSGVNQGQPNCDSIGDISYDITGGADAKDYYPLMVPLIGQCLLPWGSEKLGLPPCTESVCDKGCALTSTAMVFSYYGVDTNPEKLNKCLKANKGFSGCLINWTVAANNCSEEKVKYTYVSSSLLDQELDAGHPVILHVPGTNPNHFVVATSRMGDTYYINDPLNYGERTTLKKYGNTFDSIRMFRPRHGDLNIAFGKPVTVTTNGADEPHDHVGEWPSDITDGSLDYQPVSSGIEDGCVAWVNDNYNELMIVTVTIDLQGTYNINKIRYNMGNCQRAETWNADIMESPFGRTTTNPGTPYSGAWTEQTGDITSSSVTIKFEKTRTAWERDWLFIGEIEVWGTPVETSEFEFVHLTDVHIGSLTYPYGSEEFDDSVSRFSDALIEIQRMKPRPSFILITGDMVEYNEECFFEVFKNFIDIIGSRIPVYCVPGNHDRRTKLGGDDNLVNYHKYIDPPDNYAFDYGKYRFIGLDSGKDDYTLGVDLPPEGSGLTDDQIEKLKNELGNNTRKQIIFMHHPAINDHYASIPDDAPGGNDACIILNRKNFIDYCKNNNVQLVLTGHTHADKCFDANGGYTMQRPLFIQTRSATKDNDIYKHGYRRIKVSNSGAFPYPSTATGTLPKIMGSVTGSVNLHAYDSQGRHTGSSTLEIGIPESFYTGNYKGTSPSMPQIIILYNTSDNYSFEIVSNFTAQQQIKSSEVDTFNFTVEQLTTDCLTTIYYYNVSITQNTTATLPINLTTTNYTMLMDTNGDGEIDETKDPDSIEINYAPTATIISPENGSTYNESETIEFNGTGTDPEDGVLANLSLLWTSNINGLIGVGNEFSTTNLSVGTHTVTLMVNDSGGLTDAQSITITVNEIAGPRTIYVHDDFEDDPANHRWNTIQEGVNDANDGDTIIVRDGTYTENVDVNKSLTIQSENGSDFTIAQAANSSDHIFKVTADYVNISGFMIKGSEYSGLYFNGANNCTTSENTAANNIIGIVIMNSSYNNIINNNASYNGIGILVRNASSCIIEKNIANNNTNIPEEVPGIIVDGPSSGILLGWSNHTTISENKLSNNDCGLSVYYSLSNHLIQNNASNNYWFGILLFNKNQNFNSSNILSNNLCSSNGDSGIYLFESSNNTLTNNAANSNNKYGIYLDSSDNNTIYLNNFINNTDNVYSVWSTNIWNSTEKITYTYKGKTYENYLGNYWDDYIDIDVNNDGIGETHYPIDSDKDYHPLMKPFENYLTPAENVFDTSAPANPYPSIFGTHNGTLTPNQTITVSKLYTYPCTGTGGHTEYARIWNSSLDTNATWNGYTGDWHNISFSKSFTLVTNETYNYTIKTGSYPQVIHESCKEVTGGAINCTKFVDANGKKYNDWIPAIKLWS